MPNCPKCQNPYDEWQHFCLQCGNYLKETAPLVVIHSEEAPEKESAPRLEPKSSAAGQEPGAPLSAASFYKRLAVVIVVGLLILEAIFFIRQQNRQTMPELAQPAGPTAQSPDLAEREEPAGSKEVKKTGLEAGVEGVCNDIRQANLKKNLPLFMSTLAKSYPEIDKKRRQVIKTWKKYDFGEMTYTLDKLQEINAEKALAEIKWTTTSQNLATKYWRTDEFRYRVWLANEQGQWKIAKIEQVQQ